MKDAVLVCKKHGHPEKPKGWKLVPMKPTPEMLVAGDNELSGWVAPAMHSADAYRAMLDAAPAASSPEADERTGMCSVTREDANNYCAILSALGMEEEGDPVAEVKRLIAFENDAKAAARASPAGAGAWDAFVATLPAGAQQNVREALARGESITKDAFEFALHVTQQEKS